VHTEEIQLVKTKKMVRPTARPGCGRSNEPHLYFTFRDGMITACRGAGYTEAVIHP
jgi:hypothetical protein